MFILLRRDGEPSLSQHVHRKTVRRYIALGLEPPTCGADAAAERRDFCFERSAAVAAGQACRKPALTPW